MHSGIDKLLLNVHLKVY